jgi:iron complex transport system substrate-binding protein
LAAEEADKACQRILSTAPSATETCCALGLARCLVGRTRYCTYPPAVASVTSIGALNDLNVETLLGLAPDMVLVSGTSRAITDRIARLGVRFETVPDVSLNDLYEGIRRVGELCGRPQTADGLIAAVRADLGAVAARFAAGPSERVLIATAPLRDPPGPVDAAGPGSFYDDLLHLGGHANALPPGSRPFSSVTLEAVLHADPDVIVELVPDAAARPLGDADALRIWAKVGDLKAVAAGRVYTLVGPQHFVLGPRIARTFEALCELIHRGESE